MSLLIMGNGCFFQSSIPQIVLGQATLGSGAEEREAGIALFRKKDFTEAEKLLKRAIEKNKLDETSWYYLGLVLMQQPNAIKNASKAFETSLRLRPNFAAAHESLSYSYLRRNKTAEALREAQAALRLEPTRAKSHYVISEVRLLARNYREALKESTEAIRLSPELAAAYLVKSQAQIGLYADKIMEVYRPPVIPMLTPTIRKPLSQEELAERRRKRKSDVVPLAEAAETLETYLKVVPPETDTTIWREQLETLRIFTELDTDLASNNAVFSGNEVSTKARVLSKPEPCYTELARREGVKGTVILRAIFSADGTVRNILVINGLPFGLTECALESARRIKFTPATINGKAVSMFIQMEYNFNMN